MDTASAMPTEETYAHNFINGRWVFPLAPYEYEIRNPVDSTISAVVPLSSRNDVARAITAARSALSGPWSDQGERAKILAKLLIRIGELAPELTDLQALESGVSSRDSADMLDSSLRVSRTALTGAVLDGRRPVPGVSGHVLSWGQPLTEMLLGVFSALSHGHCLVVKPSLRAPLTPVAFADIANAVGLPAGVLNIVQGTGVDVGAALVTSTELDYLHVHGNAATRESARRAGRFTGVQLSTLSSGGNAAVVFPQIGAATHLLAAETATAVRLNSAGGLYGQPLLAVHRDTDPAVLDAVIGQLSEIIPAPLPSEPIRRRAMAALDRLTQAGGRLLTGGSIPDDATHRMSWRMPPTVVDLGDDATVAAAALAHAGEPLGPVLSVVRWSTFDDLRVLCSNRRHRDGYAGCWGDDFLHGALPFGQVGREQGPLAAARRGLTPPAWLGAPSEGA